jgi:excinuclease ABC subunit C
MGPCQGLQTLEEYDESIEQIRSILKRNFGSVVFYLKKKMNEYAANMEFEKAQEFKEKINALDTFQSRSTIVNPNSIEFGCVWLCRNG